MPVRFDDLTLHYQPQVSADGSRIVAVEALLRVLKPTPRLMSPADVLAHFREPGDAEMLDFWVFRQACSDARRWPGLSVSVNLTVDRFRDPDLAAKLIAIAAEAGMDPRRIEIEIVENAYIGDFETALGTIAALRERGFRIAIDDFGTGFSSLSYLLRLPVDKLKIDKCFVENVTTMKSAAIVQSIAALGRALGLKITAEGVETAEQWRFLKAAGCHYMQGWLFSPAVDPATVDEMLTAGTPLARADAPAH